MAWPPTPLPVNFGNATVSLNTHPQSHNTTNATINNDLVPEIESNRNQQASSPGATRTTSTTHLRHQHHRHPRTHRRMATQTRNASTNSPCNTLLHKTTV